MMDRVLDFLRRFPWTVGSGGFLVLALLVTVGLRSYALQTTEQKGAARQEAALQETLDAVEKQFGSLREHAYARAQQVASDSVVVGALANRRETDGRSSSLLRHVADLPLDEHVAVEVYGRDSQVLAWKGNRVPQEGTTDVPSFQKLPQSRVVADGENRRALVVWVPVRTGDKRVGAVRVARLLEDRPPVQNRYIQAFDVVDRWERVTGASLRVSWGEETPAPSGASRALRGPDGHVLGYVTVEEPTPAQLVRRTKRAYDDVLAGGAALLLLWSVGLAGTWYLRLGRRPGTARLPQARAAAAQRFAVVALLWVGTRYAFLGLDVPGRWAARAPSIAGLFDPTRLASTVGGGLFRSIGDLFLTGGWAVVLAVGLVHLGLRYRVRANSLRDLAECLRGQGPRRPSNARFFGVVIGGIAGLLAGIVVLASVVRRVVLDSTLDYFSRTGLLPEPLVLVVLCSLFLLVLAVLLAGGAGTWMGLHLLGQYRPRGWPRGLLPLSVFLLCVVGIATLYLNPSVPALMPFPYPVAVLGVVGGGAAYGLVGRRGGSDVLTIRGQLFCLFLVTLLLYPLLYMGMDAQRRERMVGAARSFEEGYDPHVLYALQQGLRAAEEGIQEGESASDRRFERIDSVSTRLVRRSLLATQTSYEVSLSLFDADGTLLRRYATAGGQGGESPGTRAERRAFESLRRLYDRQLEPGPVVDRLAEGYDGRRGTGRFRYAGLLKVPGNEAERSYWVLLQAEPRSLLPGTTAGVPRVLLPEGSYGDLYAEVSLAEFQGGALVRSFGRAFNRVRLPTALASRLDEEGQLWRTEEIRGQSQLTYYYRAGTQGDDSASVIAARIPAIGAFDHLYYLLRLTVVGLGVGVLFYLFGLYGRYRSGLVPADRIRFRDKVLNAFLVVGVLSMAAVGVVGVRVVTGENERLVERQLNDQLSRVEETLALEARPGEPFWQTATRVNVDSLAARAGAELRFFEEGQLVGTSRPRLVRDGLVEERLPASVYVRLHEEGYRFTTAEAFIGEFQYRVGYQALVDDEGRPRLVVGVPTLGQQEHVQREQARTLAYLFGALLVLVVMVMLTAVVLANALAKPIARLREGLEAVGEGRFSQPLPVDTRDEIGDLVRTFNEMREQLAESRRKLAQQERELAWREMARQVAHEIKNPLTPMKLSIQHLRRTFKKENPVGEQSRFREAFDRITSTLIEQIESLVRIADEFSTFARLPTRVPEPLDLNEVLEEAVRLLDEEGGNQLDLDLYPEPLVVEADREELRRIYINLIKNALQAIPDGRDGQVRISTTVVHDGENSLARSRVVDNGTGVPPDLRDKIFEPNFSTKTSGTGLGLAIAQKAVGELGGDIGFETTEGAGTTFWVDLPLAEDANQEDAPPKK